MNIIKRIFKVRSKATVYFDRNGEVIEIKGNIGRTRRARAAGAFHYMEPTPSLGIKLISAAYNCFCFFRRNSRKSCRNRRRSYSQQHSRKPGSRHTVVLTLGGSRG